MNDQTSYRFGLPTSLLLVACLLAPPAGRAEVAVSWNGTQGHPPTTVVMTTSEGPDPIDALAWKPIHTNVSILHLLNTSGWVRKDGPPSIAWHPDTAFPVVVWSYDSGTHNDIAFAEWTPNGWSPVQFVSAEPGDELDPHVFIDGDGTYHVTWWVDEAVPRIYRSERSTIANGWSTPAAVTMPPGHGRRPSIAKYGGVVYVAYERDAVFGAAAQEVVVWNSSGIGGSPVEVMGTTSRTSRLDPILHSEQGELWLEWKHVDGVFGYRKLENGGWQPLETTSWTDPGWIGVEETRARVRGLVIP